MPKLLVATGIFHPEAGGPATYLHGILPALQERGWEIRVLTYGEGEACGYPYAVTRVGRRILPLRILRYGLAARQQMKWADVIYAHTIDLPLWGGGGRPLVMKIAGDQAWERCVRKGWIPLDMSIDDFQDYRGDWRVRWQRSSRSRQVAAADAVIVPSRYLRRMVAGWGVAAEKAALIYNAMPPVSRPALDREELRAELGWDGRILLTAARLHPWKGLDYLIAAIADMPGIRLVVAGEGPDRPRLQALAAPLGDAVQFVGALPQSELHKLMVAADVLAVYSAYEGLSHTLLEGLQLGTPILASDRGGNPELARDGENGLVIPYGNLAALREGIRELLEGRESYAANTVMGLERFRFGRMVERTDALLKSQLR